jgi:hypothetical protein
MYDDDYQEDYYTDVYDGSMEQWEDDRVYEDVRLEMAYEEEGDGRLFSVEYVSPDEPDSREYVDELNIEEVVARLPQFEAVLRDPDFYRLDVVTLAPLRITVRVEN